MDLDDILKLREKKTNKKLKMIELAKIKYSDTLSELKYIPTEKISKGDIIRYVDLNLQNVSATCIVTDIEYYVDLHGVTDETSIKHIVVRNDYNDKYWVVKPQKYLVYKYVKQNKLSKFLKKYLN